MSYIILYNQFESILCILILHPASASTRQFNRKGRPGVNFAWNVYIPIMSINNSLCVTKTETITLYSRTITWPVQLFPYLINLRRIYSNTSINNIEHYFAVFLYSFKSTLNPHYSNPFLKNLKSSYHPLQLISS